MRTETMVGRAIAAGGLAAGIALGGVAPAVLVTRAASGGARFGESYQGLSLPSAVPGGPTTTGDLQHGAPLSTACSTTRQSQSPPAPEPMTANGPTGRRVAARPGRIPNRPTNHPQRNNDDRQSSSQPDHGTGGRGKVTVAFLVAVAAAESGRPTLMFLTQEAVRLVPGLRHSRRMRRLSPAGRPAGAI